MAPYSTNDFRFSWSPAHGSGRRSKIRSHRNHHGSRNSWCQDSTCVLPRWGFLVGLPHLVVGIHPFSPTSSTMMIVEVLLEQLWCHYGNKGSVELSRSRWNPRYIWKNEAWDSIGIVWKKPIFVGAKCPRKSGSPNNGYNRTPPTGLPCTTRGLVPVSMISTFLFSPLMGRNIIIVLHIWTRSHVSELRE